MHDCSTSSTHATVLQRPFDSQQQAHWQMWMCHSSSSSLRVPWEFAASRAWLRRLQHTLLTNCRLSACRSSHSCIDMQH